MLIGLGSVKSLKEARRRNLPILKLSGRFKSKLAKLTIILINPATLKTLIILKNALL
jgi:hypothetical protein